MQWVTCKSGEVEVLLEDVRVTRWKKERNRKEKKKVYFYPYIYACQ